MRDRVAARSARAFTLVELLVVLGVIGIAAGLAFLNFDADRVRSADREAKRLAGALEHAAALAQWQGETLGVSADGRVYRFWRRGTDDAWHAIGDDDILAPRAMAAEFTVAAATYAGAPVAPDAILPFRPSGRNEPMALVLASPGGAFTIAADPLNRVRVVPIARDRDGSAR